MTEELRDIIERAVKDELWLRKNQPASQIASAVAREVIRRLDESDIVLKERRCFNPDDEYDELE